jgi:hypothetical protein
MSTYHGPRFGDPDQWGDRANDRPRERTPQPAACARCGANTRAWGDAMILWHGDAVLCRACYAVAEKDGTR